MWPCEDLREVQNGPTVECERRVLTRGWRDMLGRGIGKSLNISKQGTEGSFFTFGELCEKLAGGLMCVATAIHKLLQWCSWETTVARS